jgi:high-affinity iron transporter
MPVYAAFRATSALLILFAAGLLARGVHEFAEAGIVPELNKITLHIIPAGGTVAGDMIKAVFGISRGMDPLQITLYTAYVAFMTWYVFFRQKGERPAAVEEK